MRANALSPNFAIKCRKKGTVNCFLTSPFDRYTYSEPFLQMSSLHLILASNAGTTSKFLHRVYLLGGIITIQ